MDREKYIFSGDLSTGMDDLHINFEFVKCITKSKYTYTVMERWREGFHQEGKELSTNNSRHT